MRDRRREIAAACRAAASLGLPGIVLHGFPRELAAAWDAEAALVAAHGLAALASWGEDLSADNDGTRLTAQEKGRLAGQVLARPSCAGGLLDAEGDWDRDDGPDDDEDESGALALGSALRAEAPDAWVGDQPWFAIESHGGPRRTPLPIGLGGPFAGFPSDEFASFLTWGRFRQAYCNDFTRQFGAARYREVFAWMDRDWGRHDKLLAAHGLSRPLRVTIQGYGWVPHHLAHCVLTYAVERREPLVVWCEPVPTDETLAVLRGVQALVAMGFAAPQVDARTAVAMFQRDANLHGARLDVDGWMGPATLAAMGIA